jgi:DNA-binding NarL/FixJ family response regulator
VRQTGAARWSATNAFDEPQAAAGPLGAGPWAERAHQELRAAGEPDLAVRPREGGVLSPQELRIAEMAASGMSNRQIGQQLYLSHRTVATRLYRIFPKLSITSRFQMPHALRALSAVQPSPDQRAVI